MGRDLKLDRLGREIRGFLSWGRAIWYGLGVGGVVLVTLKSWWLLVLGAVILVAREGVLEYREYTRSQRLEAAKEQLRRTRAEYDLAFGDLVGPIAQVVARVADARDPLDRKMYRQQLGEKIVAVAARLCGDDTRVRAIFYALSGDGNALEEEAFTGRGDPPRTRFQRGEPSSAHVFELLDTGELLLVPNTEHPDPGIPPLRDRPYRTYIFAPVRVRDAAYGVLLVDAPDPGDLTYMHRHIVGGLAQLLAAGMAFQV